MVKNYFNRLFSNCKKWEIVLWWVLRAIMIFGLGLTLFKDKIDIGISDDIPMSANIAQMIANFVAMFMWEIFLMLPEKNCMRHLPSYIQDFSCIWIILGAFAGAFFNFYYTVWWWDAALHFVGCFLGVFISYEVICAMQKRDKDYYNVHVAVLCSMGFCLFIGILWEVFEFSYDHIAGGDSQHWNEQLAILNNYHNFIPTIYPGKFALMDTMCDTICNFVGGIMGYFVLKAFPYHHKGKNDLNKIYPKNAEIKETASVK